MARLLSARYRVEASHYTQRDPEKSRAWPRVGRLNLDADGQGDLRGHGGEQRAVFVYQIESYRYWLEQLKRTDVVHGQFGENFTVEGLPDDPVCIGDRYQIGGGLFEVTQPRGTCYGVGILVLRLRRPAAARQSFAATRSRVPLDGALSDQMKIEANGAAGTYLRGHVRMGDVLDVSSPRRTAHTKPEYEVRR
jgi:hypothetical protein